MDGLSDIDIKFAAIWVFNMNEWAASWTQINRQANARCGWTPILERPSFIDNSSFVSVEGLNK